VRRLQNRLGSGHKSSGRKIYSGAYSEGGAMKHLQDLPNIEGFRFVGITHDNERKECFVAKDLMGCHIIKGEATWFDLDGWEDAPPKQLKPILHPAIAVAQNKG